jgi:hypothetical protein
MIDNKRRIHWVAQSSDKKIGKVLASYSSKDTCPNSCSLKEGGCYAWGLFYLRSLGRKIGEGLLGKTVQEAFDDRHNAVKIARHRVAGDIVGDQQGTLEECIYLEEKGLTNIGYTHDWRSEETQILKRYFRASCQNEEEVLEARNKGWATTLIVNEDVPNSIKLSNGEKAVMCPVVREERKVLSKAKSIQFDTKKAKREYIKQGKSNIKTNCNLCTLCKVNDKTEKITVMFEVHGAAGTIKQASGKIG